jgi:Pectate lyase superfamily protein
MGDWASLCLGGLTMLEFQTKESQRWSETIQKHYTDLAGRTKNVEAAKTVVVVTDSPYGAKGDGVQDDTKAIQAAVNDVNKTGGGIVFIPATETFYNLTSPIYVRSGVMLMGEGQKSHLKNTRPQQRRPPDQAVLLFGNYRPRTFTELDYRPVEPYQAGATTVVLRRANDSTDFQEGQVVLLRSQGYVGGRGGVQRPELNIMNRVVSVQGNELTLSYPIKTAHQPAYIVPADRFPKDAPDSVTHDLLGEPQFVCDRGGAYNLGIESVGRTWTAQWGWFEGYLGNIWISKSRNLVYGNGASHCLIENIYGYFANKAIETALFSHETVIRNIYATAFHDEEKPANVLVKFGEGCSDLLVENVKIDAKDYTGDAVILFANCYRCIVSNVTAFAPGVKVAAVDFRAVEEGGEEAPPPDYTVALGEPKAPTTVGNQVVNSQFYVEQANQFVRFNLKGGVLEDNLVTASRFVGEVKQNPVGQTAGAASGQARAVQARANANAGGGNGQAGAGRNRQVDGGEVGPRGQANGRNRAAGRNQPPRNQAGQNQAGRNPNRAGQRGRPAQVEEPGLLEQVRDFALDVLGVEHSQDDTPNRDTRVPGAKVPGENRPGTRAAASETQGNNAQGNDVQGNNAVDNSELQNRSFNDAELRSIESLRQEIVQARQAG